jgi:hypothetical protein
LDVSTSWGPTGSNVTVRVSRVNVTLLSPKDSLSLKRLLLFELLTNLIKID